MKFLLGLDRRNMRRLFSIRDRMQSQTAAKLKINALILAEKSLDFIQKVPLIFRIWILGDYCFVISLRNSLSINSFL